jgi:hypothetical protein
MPTEKVVDWILVELRETEGGPETATSETLIARQAAFVLNSGSIVAMDGFSNLQFEINATDNLYLVIWHRNHLGVMSSVPLQITNGVYNYDFTTELGKAYLNGQASLGGGKYGMIAGNADGTAMVDATDISAKWGLQAGKKGYHSADMDMNNKVNNPDKNDIWMPNIGKWCKVPQ